MDNNISRREMLKVMGISAATLAAGAALPSGLLSATGLEHGGADLLNGGADLEHGGAGLEHGGASSGDQGQTTTPDPFANNPYPVVYSGPDVVIRQINDHLWVGNGHLYSNESIYIYEGRDRAALIDTGTVMDNLDKIVASITNKPVTVLLTHQHPDHAGSVKWFPQVWSSPLDEPSEHIYMPDYKGIVHHFENHQVFDLGGKKLEVIYAPGHTPGSVLFVDPDNHIGFSGDAFGSGYLLMFTDHKTYADMSDEVLDELCAKKIYCLYPGHFVGTNHDTTKRVFDLGTIAKDLRDGKIDGQVNDKNPMVNRYVIRDGSVYNYREK